VGEVQFVPELQGAGWGAADAVFEPAADMEVAALRDRLRLVVDLFKDGTIRYCDGERIKLEFRQEGSVSDVATA